MPSAAPPQPRSPSSAFAAYVDGWRRLRGAAWMIGGLLAAGIFLFGPPPGIGSEQARLLPAAVDPVWLVVHEAFGFGIGPAGPMALADAVLTPSALSALGVYLACSAGLWGGVLDRLARRRRVGTGPFFAACGVHGVRFARLYLIAIPVYVAVFAWVFPLLLALSARLAAGSDGVVLLGAALAGLLPILAVVGAVVEYARARIVVEDRHSALGAILAALRFLRRRPGRVALLYGINGAMVWLLVLAGTTVAAEAASAGGWIAAIAWLALRILVRLASAAAAVSFFQAELAHAGYAAAPLPMWPDSPTVEGLRNLRL